MHFAIQHTINIFERLYANLPPLLPDLIKQEMAHGVDHLKNDFSVTLPEAEQMMVVFGKKVWPYWKAFEEFLNVHETHVGEKFFAGKLSRELRQRYDEFKAYGGDWRDLHCGKPMTFFTSEERVEICHALIEADKYIRDYTTQAVLSTERSKYEDRIIEFQTILDDLEKRLDTLRLMADDEQEHPQLADEIRERIKAFEHGLCFLAPHAKYEDVCMAEEHFVGRKAEKTWHRF